MEIAIIALSVVVIAQSIERHFYAKDVTGKLNDAIKAVMSRNIGEYLSATKPVKAEIAMPSMPDEVQLSDASDSEFDKFIKDLTK